MQKVTQGLLRVTVRIRTLGMSPQKSMNLVRIPPLVAVSIDNTSIDPVTRKSTALEGPNGSAMSVTVHVSNCGYKDRRNK